MNPDRSILLARVAIPVAATAMILAGCSNGGGGTASPSPVPASPTDTFITSPSPTASPTTSAQPFEVTVAGWAFELVPATGPPVDWPPDIPAPDEGVLQATGTGEPTFTASDHPIMAVQYMAPGEVAEVRSAQATQMKAEGWKAGGKDHRAEIFTKGNNSARIFVEPNASTGGVTVYQWT